MRQGQCRGERAHGGRQRERTVSPRPIVAMTEQKTSSKYEPFSSLQSPFQIHFLHSSTIFYINTQISLLSVFLSLNLHICFINVQIQCRGPRVVVCLSSFTGDLSFRFNLFINLFFFNLRELMEVNF